MSLNKHVCYVMLCYVRVMKIVNEILIGCSESVGKMFLTCIVQIVYLLLPVAASKVIFTVNFKR